MGSSIGVANTGDDSRRKKSKTSNDSSGPLDTSQIDGLSVGNGSLKASHALVGVGQVDVDADLGVKIGDTVGDAWDPADGVLRNGEVEGERNTSSSHGTQTVQLQIARVDNLLEEIETISIGGDVELDFSLDGGGSRDVEGRTVVAGGEDDVKVRGGKLGVGLTNVKGICPEQL